MRICKKWSKFDLNYLKKNYGKVHTLQIAEKLNRTQKQIIAQASYLKLTKPKGVLKTKLLADTQILLKTCGPKLIGDYNGISKKAKFECSFCGNIFETTPDKVISKHTKSCGCVSLGKRKGTQYISYTLFDRIVRGAKSRNIEFNVSLDFLDELLIQQNFKCKLSGVTLFGGYRNLKDCTISLDRIDSNLPYIETNVQWVHKYINLAKQGMSNMEFIQMCKNVASYS